MKIAITGATGFVGSHLTTRLESEGHDVVQLVRGDLDDVDQLRTAFAGCHAVAHCAGINRELGDQTYERVHVQATRNVVEAAKLAGVEKIVLTSFVRARPDCGSPYHESKWAAEEIVRNSGLDYTVLKTGVIEDKGDCSLAIEDLVHVLRAALIDRRLKRQTVAVFGPTERVIEPDPPVVSLPYDLVPRRRFTSGQTRQ